MAAVVDEETTIDETDEPIDPEQKQCDEPMEEQPPIKPGMARNIKLYLVDPSRFVIQWNAPKKMGYPLPLIYNIEINGHSFEGVVSQRGRAKRPYRVMVTNCDVDEMYKLCSLSVR